MDFVYVERARSARYSCELCGHDIVRGASYRSVRVRIGHRETLRRVRCAQCPEWRPWDLSDSLRARLRKIVFDFTNVANGAENWNDVDQALTRASGLVRGIVREKRTASRNVEYGFGHPTIVSRKLASTAKLLELWAEKLERVPVPEPPHGASTYSIEMDEWRGELVTALAEVGVLPPV